MGRDGTEGAPSPCTLSHPKRSEADGRGRSRIPPHPQPLSRKGRGLQDKEPSPRPSPIRSGPKRTGRGDKSGTERRRWYNLDRRSKTFCTGGPVQFPVIGGTKLDHRAGGCELLGRMTVDQLGPADQQILVRRTGPITVNRGYQVGPPFAETLWRQDAAALTAAAGPV